MSAIQNFEVILLLAGLSCYVATIIGFYHKTALTLAIVFWAALILTDIYLR